MAVTGRTGADAIAHFFHLICGTLKRYGPKLSAVIVAAQTAGAITSEQATLMNSFITVATATCDAFQALAGFSGF